MFRVLKTTTSLRSLSLSRRVVGVGRGNGGGARREMGAGGGGDMPVPQSMNAKLWQGHPKKEGWETTMLVWYSTSFVLLVAILGFAPATEIELWAKQEAQARLATQDEIVFGTHYQNVEKNKTLNTWDKYSVKSVRMTEDDDDDDEEEEQAAEDEDEDE